MPTGYTTPIKDGITFEEFVWDCARAFGALIEMRDESKNAPIPVFTPSTYAQEALEKEEKELERIRVLSAEDAGQERLAEYERDCEWRRKANKEHAELRDKYEAMIRKVEAWKPPTADHAGLKTFMLEQLNSSIEFDCRDIEMPSLTSTTEWLRQRIRHLLDNIERYKKEIVEEHDRAQERNEWVEQLNASVPAPSKRLKR